MSLEETNEEVLGEVSYELDNLEASPVSASVLDIIAASGSGHFPNEVIKCQELYCLLCDVPFLSDPGLSTGPIYGSGLSVTN